MVPYILFFSITLFAALRERQVSHAPALQRRWGFWLFCYFSLLTFFVGFRDHVGGDWDSYLIYINEINNSSILDIIQGADPAYFLLNWISANVGGEIYLVNLICAAFFTWGLIEFSKAQPRPWLAILVASPYLIIVVSMGYTRQGVAVGLIMLGFVWLARGKITSFLFYVILGALFHKTAVVLSPLALLGIRKNRLLTLFVVLIVCALLYAVLLRDHIDGLILNYIEAQYDSSGAAVRIAMNTLPASIFLLLNKRFKLCSIDSALWNGMAWLSMLQIPAYFLSPSSTAIDRISLYWIPLQLFVWSRLPDALGGNSIWKFIITMVISIYSACSLLVWLFFADHSFAWLPYRSLLFR